jgi:hypothetical protein
MFQGLVKGFIVSGSQGFTSGTKEELAFNSHFQPVANSPHGPSLDGLGTGHLAKQPPKILLTVSDPPLKVHC